MKKIKKIILIIILSIIIFIMVFSIVIGIETYIYDKKNNVGYHISDKYFDKIEIVNQSIDSTSFKKYYYNEDEDKYFKNDDFYTKVEEKDVFLIMTYFDHINKNYDTETILLNPSIHEIINVGDYYYLKDYVESCEYCKQYDHFQLAYYDIERHTLYYFGI